MSRGDAVMIAAMVGGGALGLGLLGSRKAEGAAAGALAPLPSTTPPPDPPPPPVPPGPALRPGTAPLSAWNRRTDDGGPPLHIADDVEALARILASEVGRGSAAERLAIGWVARNRARQRGVSVARLCCAPCGNSSGNKRPFSTRLPATTQGRELAAMILASPQSQDPTQGATSCFVPGLQDRLHAAGKPGHKLDARGVRSCWLRRLDYYGTVGRWDLFGPKGGPGARAVPAEWQIDGHDVCCSNDKRPACAGKAAGDKVEG